MQIMDELTGEYKERFMLNYNFPGFATGEPKPDRGPGRREIGHGALARRGLSAVLPSEKDFSYTMRIVSDILESNGSSSMASVCGGCLALFDAGVPVKSLATGISMGMVSDGIDNYKILTDIQGPEDHHGDMDFKVAGTKKGVTALQMDVKVDGVTIEMLKAVLAQSHENRMEIMEKIIAAIDKPRKDMSQYAPRIIVMKINPDKIRNVIGTGGKIINEIIDETGVQIDIEDDGSIFITSVDEASSKKAQEWIDNLTHEVKSGEKFNAKVTRIMNFGAFAEILPGQEGLIHISELADYRVEKVEDIVKVGDVVPVKVIKIDEQGRINLSMKAIAKMMK
jgi:polyribonucleotide nucleotidyltransferase